MTDEQIISAMITAYEDEPGVRQFSAMRAALAVAKTMISEEMRLESDDLVRAEREACKRLAGGWRCEASGDNYQTSGGGNFWDDDSIYGQGRTEAAAAIGARTTKEQK